MDRTKSTSERALGRDHAGAGGVRALHSDVDRDAAAIASQHGDRLQCRRGCAGCCVDGIRVFEVEAERIRAAHPELLAHGEPHAPGACAFLDAQGACRIHADRPYVCRTQGLPLRWFEPAPDGSALERRDVCPLNLEGVRLEDLPEDALWRIGPAEQRLATLQHESDGGVGRRVALRALFAKRSPG